MEMRYLCRLIASLLLACLTSTTRANGASSSYTYTDTGALWTLSHVIGGGGSVTSTFGYNRALQVTGRTTDNELYAWTNH